MNFCSVSNRREKTTPQKTGKYKQERGKNLEAWEHLAQQRCARSCNELLVSLTQLASLWGCAV